MRVNLKKISDSKLNIILSVVGISLIVIIFALFDVFGISHLKQLINDGSSLGMGYRKEIVYDIFLAVFLVLSIACPIYLYKIACEIRRLSTELRSMPSTDLNFRQACKNNNAYSSIWEEYSSTFIRNPKEEKYKEYDNKTTSNADLYFNKEQIILHHPLKLPLVSFLKLISGAFVGLGIVGTFIGFTQALAGGIDIQNKEQLNIIVNGLKLAFNTSICGIFSSIIYNFLIVQPVIQSLNDKSRYLCDLLDSFYYISDEECLRKLGDVVYETSHEITSVSNDTVNDIKDVIMENRNNFMAELNNASETFRDVSEKLGKSPEYIMEMNQELKNSINLVKSNYEQMLTYSVKSIEEKINLLFEKFADRFDNSSNNIENCVLSLKTFPNELNKIKEDYSQMNTVLTAITNIVKDVDLELNNTFANVPTEIDHAVARLVDAAVTTTETTNKLSELKQLPNLMANILNKFADTSKLLETTYESVLNKIEILYDVCNNKEKNTSDTLKDYIESIDIASLTSMKYEQSLNGMHNSIDEMHGVLNKLYSIVKAIKDNKESKRGN